MRVLVTGFAPFGGDAENASGEAVRLLGEGWSTTDAGIELVTAELPVAFAAADAAIADLLAATHPDAVIAVGEAGGRSEVTPERLARNRDDARIPDNDGDQPRDREIMPGGSDLPTRLDVDAIVAAMVADGLPASASDDAGAFVCNHIFHTVLASTDVPAGFIHVPAVRTTGVAGVGAETDAVASTQAQPSAPLTLDDLARALALAVRATAASSPA